MSRPKGSRLAEEHKRKIKEARANQAPPRPRGYKMSEEQKAKIGLANKGNAPWSKGKKWALTRPQKREKIAGRPRPNECEICGAMGVICFDHDHSTGKFRGWICRRCNLAMGLAKDDYKLLEAMAGYLRTAETEQKLN